MSENQNKNNNWNLGIMAAAAAAATGLAYYLGFQNGNQSCQDQMQQQHSRSSRNARSAPSGESCSTNGNCDNYEDCAICLKKMKPIQRLNCGHIYHQECVSGWLPISSTCPVCRAPQ